MNRIGTIVVGFLLAIVIAASLYVVDQRQFAWSTRWVKSKKSSVNLD